MEAPAGCGLGGAMFKLPGMLEGLLRHHGAELPKGAENEIPLIKLDLEEIITILKGRSNSELQEDGCSTRVFSCWVKEVRELSYDMEDFIDEYEHVRSHSTTPRRNRLLVSRRRPGRSKMTAPYWLREQLRQRLWTANKIREFSARAQEALRRHAMYNLGSIAADVSGTQASTSFCHLASCLHDELLVGIDAAMHKLEEWLMTMHGDEHQNLRVVSVVGPGGVGKTTLAEELYRKLGHHFECRAFVRTSQKSDIRKLFISMISQLGLQQIPNDSNVHSLMSSIRSHLQYRRYLIVLDELWCTSKWDIIKCALPDNNCCSRILIMTEIEDLALHSCGYDSTYVLRMKPLGEDESRRLFFCSLFGPQGECPPELREVSSHIVRKCGGLPLAIVMVASLLACQKETQEQWDYVNKSLGYSLITNSTWEGMKLVLNLCYNSLPEHLKACVLYMSIYQEDNIIWKDDLMNQWSAEGFICASQGQDEQEIAAAYFDELVSRKIIQPIYIKDHCEVLSFVVHHMVLNHIAAHKSIEENFVTSIHNSQTTAVLDDKIHRLSLYFGDAEDAIHLSNMRLSQVRTIAFSGVFKCMPSMVEFRLLQVLILHFWGDNDNISLDLSRISELFRLRYLKISSNATLELKTQIQGLKKLETIKIDARVSGIPSEITQLIGLLHLSLPAESDLPHDISHMTSLRTLRNFDIISNSIETIQSLSKLSNLRDLQLTYSTSQPDYLNNKFHFLLSSVLERLRNLKFLTLLPTDSYYANSLYQSGATGITISNDEISKALNTLTLLQRFEFSPHICVFSCLPKFIGQLTKLFILNIGVWKVFSNCVDVLKELPALSVLSLYVHCKPAEKIVIGNAGFPALKYFMFKCCDPMIKFDAGAMPNLRKLMLNFNAHRADQQVAVPFGIEHLTGLKEVYAELGCATSYEEPEKRAIESAFRDAMKVHGRCCRVIVTCVNKIFGCTEDQSSLPREEGTTLKRWKMEESSNEHDQSMEYVVKSVEHADSRLMLSEWTMLLLLRNKINNQNDDITSGIPVIDPYSMDPWKLADMGMGTGESPLYFRPLQEAKDGPAPSGYWRETGSAGYIYSAKRIPIGMKRTMEFSPALDKRTTWKMREFTTLQESTAHAIDERLAERGDMSLCQLYMEPNTMLQVADKSAELPKAEKYRERKVPSIKKTVVKANVEDSFSWRKYGHKDILGAKYPRSYYRCTHCHSEGCAATKQVQRTDEDPELFDVFYIGVHTCVQNDKTATQNNPHAHGPLHSLSTSLAVKTEGLAAEEPQGWTAAATPLASVCLPPERRPFLPLSSVSPATSDSNPVASLRHIKQLVAQLEEQLGESPDLCKRLASQIFSLTERSIAVITSSDFDGDRKSSAAGSGLASSVPVIETTKKRKLDKMKNQVRVRMMADSVWVDGHNWRKYDRKVILEAKHPRNYYRCAYHRERSCPATKQVQCTDEDPELVDVFYIGEHTCVQNDKTATQHNPDAHGTLQSQSSSLAVKTEGLAAEEPQGCSAYLAHSDDTDDEGMLPPVRSADDSDDVPTPVPSADDTDDDLDFDFASLLA